jgi:hypothetical protein
MRDIKITITPRPMVVVAVEAVGIRKRVLHSCSSRISSRRRR